MLGALVVRLGGEATEDVASPRRAYVTCLATTSNPLTIASWAAIFSAASVAGLAVLPLLAGVAGGSTTWFALLAGAVALARRRVGRACCGRSTWRRVSACSVFAGALGLRAARD